MQLRPRPVAVSPMSASWVSDAGLELPDLVPAELRRRWVERGWCPDCDVYALFREHVRAHPRRTAIVDTTGSLDYGSLDRVVRRIASGLAASGFGRRDVIGLQLSNSWRAVAAELAVSAIGAVLLPVPVDRSSDEVAGLLRRSRTSAIILAPGSAVSSGLRSELPHLRDVLELRGGVGSPGRTAATWVGTDTGVDEWEPASIDPEAPARILVTSGSEAEPKMIAYSHNAVTGGRANYVRSLHDGCGPMRNLVLVPLSSGFGSLGAPVTVATLGGTLLLPGAFDPGAALDMISAHRPTHLIGVPTMLQRIAERVPRQQEDLSSLRAVVSSGAPLHVSTIRACRRRFPCPIINVYGSSDGVNCHTSASDSPPESGLAGRPDPSVATIRVVDQRGDPVAAGAKGEIRARGPMTPLCYVGAPDLDERYRTEGGWVRSGDLGRLTPDGRLRVVGRIKRVVIRGGESISPARIEREILTHPRIAEAACVGLPDPDLGQRLCLCITRVPGADAIDLAEVRGFLTQQRGVRRRSLPELVVELPELPLGPTGKISRDALRDHAVGRARSRSDTTPP